MGCGPIAHVGDLESVYSSALETGFVKDEVVEVMPHQNDSLCCFSSVLSVVCTLFGAILTSANRS
eukprot:6438287-Amphidinium_carterae.1